MLPDLVGVGGEEPVLEDVDVARAPGEHHVRVERVGVQPCFELATQHDRPEDDEEHGVGTPGAVCASPNDAHPPRRRVRR